MPTPPLLTEEMIEKEKHNARKIKHILIGLFILILAWHYIIKKPFYQWVFGTPAQTPTTLSSQAIRQDVTDHTIHKAEIKGYNVNIKLLKQFHVTAYVGYIDRYDGFWGRFYRNTGSGANLAYDKIMPQDVTIVYGNMGRNIDKCLIEHQHRVAFYQCPHSIYNATESENIHTIAATPAVQAGLDILKKGDIATFEGYLIYWDTILPSGRRIDFESAVKSGQISPQKAGGQTTKLCLQLYLTRLTFDGYTFE